MLRLVAFPLLLVPLLSLGCASKPVERDNAEVAMFGPMRMRLHPIFTQVKNWSSGGGTGPGIKPDGIEAELEFQDQFGDPTKAAGKVMFELFSYHQGPDPRGDRLVNPWVGSLLSLQQQYEHWNRTSRTYSFQLAMPTISTKHSYVLTAMFEHSDGRRFFSRLILKGEEELRKGTQPLPLPPPGPTTTPTAPTTLPVTRGE
jgi:hypothetical protein